MCVKVQVNPYSLILPAFYLSFWGGDKHQWIQGSIIELTSLQRELKFGLQALEQLNLGQISCLKVRQLTVPEG